MIIINYCYLYLLILLFTISCTNDPYKGLSTSTKHSYGFISKFASEMNDKYGLSPFGSGGKGGDPGKYLGMYVAFQSNKPILKDEARRLILSISEEFLKKINENEEIRPQLQNFPFTIKNIEVAIFFTNPDGTDAKDPYIGVVGNTEGKIRYKTNDPDKEYGYKTWEEETYEEAVAIVEGQKNKETVD